MPGAFGPFARALEKHYGLSREQVAFWDMHEIADREHSDVGDHAVIRHADSADAQRACAPPSRRRWRSGGSSSTGSSARSSAWRPQRA